MPRYRTRVKEIEAFPLEDGRYLIAEDAPRYVDGSAFHDAFEPVAVAPVRAAKKSTRGKRAKATKRAAASTAARPAPEVLTFNDQTPPRDRGLAMLIQGEKVGEVAKKCGVPYQTAWAWKESLKKPIRTVAATVPKGTTTTKVEPAAEKSWMD